MTTKRPSGKSNVILSVPAPYLGLNFVDPPLATDPAHALILENWICRPEGPKVRPGHRTFVTGGSAASPTTSFLPYNARVDSQSKLFGVRGGSIYDMSTAGALGTAVQTGLSSSDTIWESVQQTATTASANYLVAVNGTDYPRLYNGSWTTASQVATPTAPGEFSINDNNGNAVSIQNFVDVCLHQMRQWFVKKNSSIGYYCDIAQVGGQLYAFDFGPLFPRGGSLHKLITWTTDASGNYGVSPLLVAISNQGDVVTFAGSNPASPSTWNYVGSWSLAAPAGRRCTTYLEGDVLYWSRSGVYPLSKYMTSGRQNPTTALSYKIAPALNALTKAGTIPTGYQVMTVPNESLVVVNITQGSSASTQQYFYETTTRAWSKATGIPAHCFTVFKEVAYFGTDTGCSKAFLGNKDNAASDGSGGSVISAKALTVFATHDDQLGNGSVKQPTNIKPIITTFDSAAQLTLNVNTDFDMTMPVGVAGIGSASSNAVWDVTTWDSPTATFSDTAYILKSWFATFANPGSSIATALVVSAVADLVWASTLMKVIPGEEY